MITGDEFESKRVMSGYSPRMAAKAQRDQMGERALYARPQLIEIASTDAAGGKGYMPGESMNGRSTTGPS